MRILASVSRRCRLGVPLWLLLLLWSASAPARTWHIMPDSSGEAATIQAGIDSSSAGDTVLVTCGTYYESGILMKSGVTLASATGEPTCATIDANGSSRVFDCPGCDAQTEIKGFMAVRGRAPGV